MNTYEVTFKDEATYTIEAETRDEAVQKGLDYWDERAPLTTAREKKKVKKTVYYSVVNFYKQDVLVDADLDNDEIKDLWYDDVIETLSEPEPAERFSEIDYNSIWVK